MSAPEIWFHRTYSGTIEAREVLRATGKCVFVKDDSRFREKKERRCDIGDAWFRTEKEAAEFVLKRARLALENAENNAAHAREKISRMERILAHG